jgi:hypothetical protein
MSMGVLLGTTLQAGGILGALILGRFIDRFGFYPVLGPSFPRACQARRRQAHRLDGAGF